MSLEEVMLNFLAETKTVLWSQECMQDQEFGDWSLDWIESFEFEQDFKELMPKRSTKIAPLSRLNLNINSLSFYSFYFLLITLIINNNFSCSYINLNKDLLPFSCTLLNEGQTPRLHNTLYITSLVSSHHHGSFEDAKVQWKQLKDGL